MVLPQKVSTLIVDDEPHSRRFLRELIELDDRFTVNFECDGGSKAIALLKTESPDLILLDIEMQRVSGFDVLKSMQGKKPLVVIVSAFGKYAVHAFDYEVFDYVTKPIDHERFTRTLNRVYSRLVDQEAYDAFKQREHASLVVPSKLTTQATGLRKSLSSIHGKQLFFNENELRYLEGARKYVKVQLLHEAHLVRDSLANLVAKLELPTLIRVHRSYAVNLSFVRTAVVSSSRQAELALDNGEVIPISRNRCKHVAELLQEFSEKSSGNVSLEWHI